MGRGHKTCKHCGETTGPRAHNCPSCGKAFEFKSEVVTAEDNKFDWRKLEPGDVIKVISGSGPYFEGEIERIPMGYHGVFKVHGVDTNGIHAYPVKANESGHCYIYMGPAVEKSPGGLVQKSHKVRKLKQKKK
jgi:hypothetical protein